MSNEEKIGVFGGAFNPVHNGHLNLAREAIEQLNLRRLLIIPTFESPHKNTKLLPFEDRAEMCKTAFGGMEVHGTVPCVVEISDIEKELGGVSYTINTLRELRGRYPNGSFYLLIGGDMLYSFTEWYKYESILKEAKVCAIARGGDSYIDMLEFASEIGRIKVLQTDIVDISSTQIREAVQNNGDISGLVPQCVADHIRANNLYRGN